MTMQLPPPSLWQDFESLCRDLWCELWKDDNTQKNGRSGQPQCGVDVYGRVGNDWHGVQCKLKDQIAGKKLSETEILEEVAKARDFKPTLKSLIFATTAPRDVETQELVRKIDQEERNRGSFSVNLFAWDDLADRVIESPNLLRRYWPWDLLLEEGREGATRYAHSLWNCLHPLPMTAIGRGVGTDRDVSLPDVYTALDVTAEISPDTCSLSADAEALEMLVARAGTEAKIRDTEDYRRRVTALEAASASPRFALLGDPGSGKSTFAKFLALCLIGERLEKKANLKSLNGWVDNGTPSTETSPWPHGKLLPLFVELRRFVGSAFFPKPGEEGNAEHLLNFLERQDHHPVPGEFAPQLRRVLSRSDHGALLILDGLDETRSADASRERLKQIILRFVESYQGCRVLITSRPFAYEPNSSWRLDDAGFRESRLAPLSGAQVDVFIDFWYQSLVARRQMDQALAKRQAKSLKEQKGQASLRPLIERPLMLTMLVDLHASEGGVLRGGRAELYERSVDLLLDRWNTTRGLDQIVSTTDLGMSPKDLRCALEELAFDVHRDQAPGEEQATITDTQLFRALCKHRPDVDNVKPDKVDQQRLMGYLHMRSGILIADSPESYRFPHRTYQEFLAACHLQRTNFPSDLLEVVGENPSLWREVFLFSAGLSHKASPFMVWSLLSSLVPGTPPGNVARDHPGFENALLAALAIEESELWVKIQPQDEKSLGHIRQWLVKMVELGALSPVDRAAGARVLGRIDDPRKGVGVENGIPVIDWVPIVDSKGNPICEMSRYTVTNAQFDAFVKDGGYDEKHHDCWSEEGRRWLRRQGELATGIPDPFLVGNHPRVMVTLHEAHAFTAWLGEKIGREVRLPTPSEWEFAATGGDGREYPWGDEFDETKCNSSDTRIGSTCAVGIFPDGVSPFGVYDMSGNVWEWCPMPDERSESGFRGGGWIYPADYLRASLAYGFLAAYRYVYLGFRVVAVPASTTVP